MLRLGLAIREYVTQEAALTENQILDTQIARDEKYASRGKQVTKVGSYCFVANEP